jgi:hypothetical protein
MSQNPWTDEAEPQARAARAEPAPPSRPRLFLERAAIVAVAVVVLLIPLAIGLLYYLAGSDGIVVNGGDLLHEARLWMVQERKGATGLGLTYSAPTLSDPPNPATQCAHTYVTFLKWDRNLRIERDADYCRCYELRDGQLVESAAATCH